MAQPRKISLLKVRQWLPTWDKVQWKKGLEQPQPHFYVGSIPLRELRELAGVTTRDLSERANPNAIQGYQRLHEIQRSKRINRYVHYGYPLSASQGLDPETHQNLINPGWLPNAIIINVIAQGGKRTKNGTEVEVPKELETKIIENSEISTLQYPTTEQLSEYRQAKKPFSEPIEVIDGQHRLFSADYGGQLDDNYEVPIVVFDDLSLGWQAYLFWTINVEPKKINASLAFDLYPELRRQEWLEQSETIKIYQEHRSQELTETLWSHPESPWRDRIELHGRRIKGHVSNAAFIRSLNASFIKRWKQGERVGGLFGSIPTEDGSQNRVIPWKRSQQAAFLIELWKSVLQAASKSTSEWVRSLEQEKQDSLLDNLPAAFAGEHTLLATDQGVRAIHNIFNAIFQHIPNHLELEKWNLDNEIIEDPTEESVNAALHSLKYMTKIKNSLHEISQVLIEDFDWRLSSAPGLSDEKQKYQAAYRGSGGYSLMMKDLLNILANSKPLNNDLRIAAREVSETLIRD